MEVLRQLDGNGVVTEEGQPWIASRQRLHAVFAAQAIPGYADLVVALTRRNLEQWPTAGNLDIAETLSSLAFDVMTQVVLGTPLPAASAAAARREFASLSRVLVGEMGQPFVLPAWFPLPAACRKRQSIRVLRGIFDQVTRTSGIDHSTDQVLHLLHAGYETLAAALAWTCWLLASHSVAAARLVREVDQISSQRPVTGADMTALTYARYVAQEALRLYTPTWIIFPREVVADVEILGHRLAPGSWVLIFPYALHRDPRWFEDAERFDPERFAPGRVESIHPYAYIPFGAGRISAWGGTWQWRA